MDKVDGAQQSWRVSRQGEQICVFIFYAYGHCFVSDDDCPHQAVTFANISHM